MADSKTVTGSREDLLVDTSRCMLMRFSESSCRRCADICPHGAIMLDGGLAINIEQCRGCLLCTAACPVGALEQSNDFSASLAQLSRVQEPVLGCIRTKEHSNASLTCLGGLSEEHLLALHHALAGTLTLNLTLCGDCHNSYSITKLKQRLETISASGLAYGNCRIDTAESAQDIHYRDESVDRRSFFKSFGNALFKSADIVLSTNDEQSKRRTGYAEKRLPRRRELLNNARKNLSPELKVRIRERFDSRVSFDETCSSCQGCVAICPTGALKTYMSDIPPIFDQLPCTGCGLCREFCIDGALRISTDNNQDEQSECVY